MPKPDAPIPAFSYRPLLDHGRDRTVYRRQANCAVRTRRAFGRDFLAIPPDALAQLAQDAFHDIAFYLRGTHLRQLRRVLDDPDAAANDRFVAWSLLRNAIIAAEGVLPLCQDTGTAIVMGWKGEEVLTGADDAEWLSRGVFAAYTQNHLRNSQMTPLDMLRDVNTGCNLPAQIELAATPGQEYRFLFVAKGGGSANKTLFFPETPSVLSEDRLSAFLTEKIRALGVAACPPYHLAIVIGGMSPELNLKVHKLAAAGFLDGLPAKGGKHGVAYRDRAWERKVMAMARDCGLGAQFGGTAFALDARVIRLPRHAASVPISVGASCNAHRQARAKITHAGVFLEKLERHPARFLKGAAIPDGQAPVPIDLHRPLEHVRRQLAGLTVGTMVALSGPLVVARDIAHARFHDLLARGLPLPEYLRKHPIYYAGPARTPPGLPTGSFGPTTAQRMDAYLPELMACGASLVTLAKGPRSPAVAAACQKHRGCYLGTIGGAAALVAREHIMAGEIIAFPEDGMEAVRLIEVRQLPAFVIVDSRGRDLYARPGS